MLLVCLVLTGCELVGYLSESGSYPSRITPIDSIPTVTEASDSASEAEASPLSDSEQPSGSDLGFYEPGSDEFVQKLEPKPAVAASAGEVTLNFEDTSLLETVKVILGDLLELDYVMDPTVQGSVTLQTSRPLPRDALIPTLELLLRMNGAALVRSQGRYQIVPIESALLSLVTPQLGDSSAALPAEFSVRVVPLEFVSAQEMQGILEPFATAGNIVRVDVRRNFLILSGTSQELTRLLETIYIFDVDWLAGMSMALFRPEFVDADVLSTELAAVFSDENIDQPSPLVRFVTIERLNALLVVTPRRQMLDKVARWVERLDKRGSTEAGSRLFVYRVQNGKAAEIAALLSEVFGGERQDAIGLPELAPGLEPVEIGTITQRIRPEVYGLADETDESQAPEEAFEEAFEAPLGSPGQDIAVAQIGALRIVADVSNNALLILATDDEYRQIRAALKELDIVPLQVLIEATIAEISLTDELEHGLEWFFKNNLSSGRGGTGALDLGALGLSPLAPGFSYAIADAAGAVRAVLNTLASDSRLNIVSSPSLMVLNNQQASIRVGDEVPITIQQQQSTSADANVVNSIEYRDTGVLLTVIPRVNPGGLVIMEIEQEVSDVAPGTGDNLTPTIQQRKINSTVAVKSGQTVVLGGLIRENKSLSQSGIPILYKLPILGPLFGATTKERRRTELVVLITPRAVHNAAAAQRITDEFRSKMRSLEPFAVPILGPEALREPSIEPELEPAVAVSALDLDFARPQIPRPLPVAEPIPEPEARREPSIEPELEPAAVVSALEINPPTGHVPPPLPVAEPIPGPDARREPSIELELEPAAAVSALDLIPPPGHVPPPLAVAEPIPGPEARQEPSIEPEFEPAAAVSSLNLGSPTRHPPLPVAEPIPGPKARQEPSIEPEFESAAAVSALGLDSPTRHAPLAPVGYLVLVPTSGDRADADRLRMALAAKGIDDQILLRRGRYQGQISVGAFAKKKGAEIRRAQVAALGFDVAVKPRTDDRISIWADLLPRDDLASEMTEPNPGLGLSPEHSRTTLH